MTKHAPSPERRAGVASFLQALRDSSLAAGRNRVTSASTPRTEDHAISSDYITAGATLLGLAIEPDWREAVATNFRLLASAAAVVELALPDVEKESALVFKA